MNLDEWRYVFVTIYIVLILGSCLPIVMAILPIRDEKFFSFSVLGQDGLAYNYYPGDDPNIELEEEVNWFIHLYNHMGDLQYVAVRVKLLNSTMSAPDSNICNPSPAPMIYEVRRVLFNNETWIFPFSWSVINVEWVGNFLNVSSFSINDNVIDTHIVSINGYNYRVVLELWIFNETLGDFQYVWGQNDEFRCAWIQVWFNVTSPFQL